MSFFLSLSPSVRHLRSVRYFGALPKLRHFPYPCNIATIEALPKNWETPPLLVLMLLNITSHVHCLSCLIANSKNLTQPAALVHIHVTTKLGLCEVTEWNENCQPLQAVYEFVEHVTPLQRRDVENKRFTHRFSSSSSSQIPNHLSFTHLTSSSHFTCMLLSPVISLSFIRALCGFYQMSYCK